jgi:ADP-ribosyl-[dinitrogen reductase] hydrolase
MTDATILTDRFDRALLVELGEEPDDAIASVRAVRPGAIETREQEGLVHKAKSVPEPIPSTSDDAIKDRAIGALLGLAVGDAVGTTLEFKDRDTYEPLTDMVGGGPFHLKAGQWTDDTAMSLALADSLHGKDDLDERDLLRRFVEWRDEGTYSCTGRCFDIGSTTNAGLTRWLQTGNPHSGSTDPKWAGNGSLMRLAPVAVRFWRDRIKPRDVAARQSKTTHAAPEAVDACVAYATMLADAIEGKPRSEVLRIRSEEYTGKVDKIMKGSWRGKRREEIRASGYVAHTLEAALWSVARTSNYRTAVLSAANLGEDADTTAAVAGQLAGALYGASGIPNSWADRVAWGPQIIAKASNLFAG